MARVNHKFGKDTDGDGVVAGNEMFVFNCEEDKVEELKAEKESEGYIWVAMLGVELLTKSKLTFIFSYVAIQPKI